MSPRKIDELIELSNYVLDTEKTVEITKEELKMILFRFRFPEFLLGIALGMCAGFLAALLSIVYNISHH